MHFRALVVALASVVFLACGSNGGGGTGGGSGSTGGGSGTGGSSGTGGTTGTGGGTTGSGGGTSGTGGGASGTGGGAAVTSSGYVVLTQSCTTVMGMDYCGASASAGFTTVTATGASNCTTTMLGACTVYECDGGTPAQTTRFDSAGVITITGTRAGAITLTPDGGKMYDTFGAQQRIWDGGEMLTVSAAGGDVPAFSGRSVVAPAPITVTNPTCGMLGSCSDVPRGSPYMVTWTGGNGGVYAQVSSSRPGMGGSTIVLCNFMSSPGVIAPAALAKLGATDAGYFTSISVQPSSSTQFTSGAWSIGLTASGQGAAGTVIIRD